MDFKFKFGEMTYYEREKLYNYIKQYNPKVIFESGTGKGGGSYVMINALCEDGNLYSCDPDRKPDFDSEKLLFFQIMSGELIQYLKDNNIKPNFLFFDGPEEPEIALEDFKQIENYVEVGTIFSMHDWCTNIRKYDKGISTKAKLLKPYINSLSNWELLEELDGENYEDGFESVGLCFYKKIS